MSESKDNNHLSTDPADHDFDWVTPRVQCTLAREFPKLEAAVRQVVKKRGVKSIKFFKEQEQPNFFSVCREAISGAGLADYIWCVHFTLEKDKIAIDYATRSGPKETLEVTVVLERAVNCRYQIDGSGRYLRWQVVERALERLLFP